MGFESALVLSSLLSEAKTRETVPVLLRKWEERRMPRMTHVYEATMKTGRYWMMMDCTELEQRVRRFEDGGTAAAGHPNMLRDPDFQQWLFGWDATEII